jgi:hypothetical protein
VQQGPPPQGQDPLSARSSKRVNARQSGSVLVPFSSR